jgi:hypothetical protein
MCGKFTQHSSWQQVHAFSQPLVIRKPDELVVSTPMLPAYIMHLDAEGRRAMTGMRWGLSGAKDKAPATRITSTLAPRQWTRSRRLPTPSLTDAVSSW